MKPSTTEVLVVGGGGAGLAAAVAAASAGSRVVLLEKGPTVGGSTALSVGSFTAAGTRHQKRLGIHDDPDAMIEDMYRFSPLVKERDQPELRRLLAYESTETIEWLESLGVPFSGPYLEPPHRVPRMHNVVPGSRMYVARLLAAARRLRVKVETGARVDRLLSDDTGRIVGAAWTSKSGLSEIRSVATILATGDYSADPALRAGLRDRAARSALPVNEYSTGDGHRLARDLGADLRSMDVTVAHGLRFRSRGRGLVGRVPLWVPTARAAAWAITRAPAFVIRPFVTPLLVSNVQPSSSFFAKGAILVNRDGDRFCEEAASVAELAEQPGAQGAIILDEAIAEQFNTPPNYVTTAPGIGFTHFRDYERARPDLVHRAKDEAGLATALGMDPGRLSRSVESAPRPLQRPFVALGPVFSMLVTTEGGIAVDPKLRVLREDGSPIAGLFAAGSSGQSGLVLAGHGFHIGWAMTSGRLAGVSASKFGR